LRCQHLLSNLWVAGGTSKAYYRFGVSLLSLEGERPKLYEDALAYY
jgi:hypothetical protein